MAKTPTSAAGNDVAHGLTGPTRSAPHLVIAYGCNAWSWCPVTEIGVLLALVTPGRQGARSSRHGGSCGLTVLVLLAVFWGGFAAPAAAAERPLMVEKNLFSAERKADESKPDAPAAEAPKLPKGAIQLDGVFIHDDVRKAILRVNPSLFKPPRKKVDPFVSVGENEQVGDYRVVKIEPRSITLEQRGTSFVIPLFMPGKVSPPPPKVASAPSAPPRAVPPGPPAQQPPARPVSPSQPPGIPTAPGEQLLPQGQGGPGAEGIPLPPGYVTPPPRPQPPMEAPSPDEEMDDSNEP